MKAEFELVNVGDIQGKLTITMPLKTWAEFEHRMADEWPGYDIRREIRAMIAKAKESYSCKYPRAAEQE